MKPTYDFIRDNVFTTPATFLKYYWLVVLILMKTFLIWYFRQSLIAGDVFWIPSYYVPEFVIFVCGCGLVWLIERIPKIVTIRRILAITILIIFNAITIVVNCMVLISIYRVGITSILI